MIQHNFALFNGVRLHFAHKGSGELVLFIHGFPEYWGVWSPYLEAIGEKYLAVAPDLRGYNLSEKPSRQEDYGIELLVEDLVQMIQNLGNGKAHIVAQDWGGVIAWSLVFRHPELVRSLTMVNIPHLYAFDKKLRKGGDLAQQIAASYMLLFRLPTAEASFIGPFGDFGPAKLLAFSELKLRGVITDEEIEAHVEAWKQPGAVKAAFDYYRAAEVGPPNPVTGSEGGSNLLDGVDPKNFQIAQPVLFLSGSCDPAILQKDIETDLNPYVSRLKLIRFPLGTHWLTAEYRKECIDHILEFLSNLS